MPNETAKIFAQCRRGLVVAPAGCGKTYLIAESVGCADGKQLILTHTHAGVDALRKKLKSLGIPSEKYRVTTIDSLALSYSNAFPQLARWDYDYPTSEREWRELRISTCRLLGCRTPRRVLQTSYSGVYIDEYQDCCGTQHAIICQLAEILPCRIVGDPLQAIYSKLHKDDIIEWSDVESVFPIIDRLSEPHRWLKHNKELGAWLSDVRMRLEKGEEIDFSAVRGIINWVESDETQVQIATCYRMMDNESVVAICDWPNRCASIAEKTKNGFSVLESVACPDLIQAVGEIETSKGLDRVGRFVEFAQTCLTGMSILSDLFERLKNGKAYLPRTLDNMQIWIKMNCLKESDDLRAVEDMMQTIEGLVESHYYKRREMWRDFKRTLRNHDPSSGIKLQETAWILRDNTRRNGGRNFPKRLVATPLLVKGLEFQHALLLNVAQMKTAEELYVALTRGASSLTVLSSESRIRRSLPAYLSKSQ